MSALEITHVKTNLMSSCNSGVLLATSNIKEATPSWPALGIFLAGFAGMIQTFRIEAPLPSQGYLLELESIAAAVIGGVSLFGGVGTIFGAAIGAILIRFLESGIIMARIDAEWFRAGLGSLIIISVVFNTWVVRRGENMVHKNQAEENENSSQKNESVTESKDE